MSEIIQCNCNLCNKISKPYFCLIISTDGGKGINWQACQECYTTKILRNTALALILRTLEKVSNDSEKNRNLPIL